MSEHVEEDQEATPEADEAQEDAETPDDDHLPDFDELETEDLFVEHDVLEPTEDGEDLRLTDGVRDAWLERVRDFRDGERTEQLGAFFDVDSEGIELSHRETTTAVNVLYESRLAGRWESEAAILSDLAAADVLDEWIPHWESYPLEPKSAVVSGFRAFVETCPDCEGRVELDQEIKESCCRTHEVYAVTCNDCEVRLLEISRMQGKPRPK